jgi:hypothetical protein
LSGLRYVIFCWYLEAHAGTMPQHSAIFTSMQVTFCFLSMIVSSFELFYGLCCKGVFFHPSLNDAGVSTLTAVQNEEGFEFIIQVCSA